MKPLVITLCLALSACATCEPKVIIETKEVSIPVVTRCKVKYPEKPVILVKEAVPDKFYEQVIQLIRENVDYRNYTNELEAVLKVCAEDDTETVITKSK